MTRRHSLTESQVAAIRAMHRPGVRGCGYGAIARRFGVGESTVRDAILYRTQYSARAKGGAA